MPIFIERKRTHLDSIERDAMEIYRKEMRNVLVQAQGSKKFNIKHDAAQKSATEHMKKKTSHLKIKNEVENYLTELKKLLKQEEQEFSAQNNVRLNVALESIKIDALAGFDKEMSQWMRENNFCDMIKLKTIHDAALNRALNKFSNKISLDSGDEIFKSFLRDVKNVISEKMRDNEEILQKTGMQQSVSLTLQRYKSGIEAVGTKTRYVGDLAAKHLKVEAEAIQFLTDLLDHSERSEEALGEAQKLINEAFETYSEVNNAMRSQHFSAVYENFERDLKIELTSLREAIRISWQKNIQQKIDEVTDTCLRVILDQNDGSTEYSNLLVKSKDHIKEVNVDLLRQNDTKMKTELETANNAVNKANEVYMTAMNKNIIALSDIPEEAQITTFHEPAKKEALDSYYKLIAPLKVVIPPDNLAKLQKAILDALEKFKIDNNLKRREKRTNEKQSGHPVGIDLGTTYSCVALYRNGIFERIKSSYDSFTTPSVVYYGPNAPTVGEAAVLKGQTDFGNCIAGVKRIIGRPYADPEVQAFKRNSYFEIVCRDGQPSIQVSKNGRKECLKVEEVSADVLREMKHQASRHLKYEVKDAVVTVPAYFTEPQRAATLEACRLADINVLRLLNEPTAAALAFGTQHQDKSLRRVLVFDFGGGTCDVSVLEVRGDDFLVKASRGDNTLGGRDLDQRLLEYVLECRQLSGKSLDRSTKSRILNECEKVKRILSDKLEKNMYLAMVDGSEFRLDITRADFERINLDLLEKALIPVKDCLIAAKLTKLEIDEIVLAGGSSHIPKMKELLTEFFGGKKLHEGINPDEAIAHGAALQAAIITKDPKLKTTIKDITPHSLGKSLVFNRYSIIIPKDSHIPCIRTMSYVTVFDNQTAMSSTIYQGENPVADKNFSLGEITLTNIRRAPAGEVEEDTTFTIDENGILHVEAQEVSDTKTNVESITINRKVIT
ncbi:hypothetical protein B566_EDAN017328 [Ephemera danica]|nr:hypothetical protein B566_EDAN017328 [Ephemera danica]